VEWGDYWRRVCAPKLKRRKEELGRAVPEREIAAAVEAATGKNSERGLVSLWLLGEREPYISQFFALCEKLGMDPAEVLEDGARILNAAARRSRTGSRTHQTFSVQERTASYKIKRPVRNKRESQK
jgi:hypothetical protein